MIQFFSISVFVSSVALVMPLAWQSSKLSTDASLHGVAVSSGGVTIVAGNGPQVWVMNNIDQTWSDRTPNIVGVTDYRCAVTPSDSVLLVASAGSPAVILRSVDFGVQWSTVHSDTRPAAFLDAIQFWDARRGIAFGDPVGGEFLILGTDDAGQTWRNLTCTVKPLEGEAGFAASNGSISLAGDSSIAIGLGGRADGGSSRVLISQDTGQTWTPHEVSVMPASASSGVFSIVLRESGFGIAVGGDCSGSRQTSLDPMSRVRNAGEFPYIRLNCWQCRKLCSFAHVVTRWLALLERVRQGVCFAFRVKIDPCFGR
jgi:hypothetical protein